MYLKKFIFDVLFDGVNILDDGILESVLYVYARTIFFVHLKFRISWGRGADIEN